MKKTGILLLSVMLILALGVPGAVAQTMSRGVNFVDENNDGICDLCGGTNANGDGVCDNRLHGGARPMDGTGGWRGNGGCGHNFVDADGDGICDNAQGAGRGRNGARGGRKGRNGK